MAKATSSKQAAPTKQVAAKAPSAKKAAVAKKAPGKKAPDPTVAVAAKAATATPKPKAGRGSAALWDQYWHKPGDRELLRIYADALEQEGDPRGLFIQLSLTDPRTPAQDAALAALEKKHKGAIVGPATAFLREVVFGPTGLVDTARTEVGNLIAGIDELGRVNPRLVLTVTSIKSQKDAEALGKVSPAALGAIWFIDFGMITGSFGGCQLDDKKLAAIAPAFAEVEHLQLSCRGNPEKCFSPAGLRALGAHLTKLRYLSVDFYSDGLPPAAAYAAAIVETPGFSTLQALDFADVTTADLQGRKLELNPLGDLNFEVREAVAAKLEALLA